MVIPFSASAKSMSISATDTASASTALPSQGNTLRIVNEGPDAAFVSVGAGAQTATLPSESAPTGTATPILPGTDISLSIPSNDVLNISAICRASKTATLTVQVGEGI